MKIVPASYDILDNLDSQSLPVRIEYCGRVCYKSEDRITEDSAIPFVRRMAEHGHNSVLEMAVTTVRVLSENSDRIDDFFFLQPRYLHMDRLDDHTLLITGSVRAFREMLLFHPADDLTRAIISRLAKRHAYFFEDIIPEDGLAADLGISVERVPLAQVDTMKPRLKEKHRHIAVKFTVNRAVTHEIVRHRPCSFLQESQRYCRYSDSKFDGQVTFIEPLFFEKDSEEYKLWYQAMSITEVLYLDLLETASPQAARTVLPNSCKTELIVYANLAEWKHIFKLRTQQAAEPSMREVMIPLQEDFQRIFSDIF